MSFAKSLRIERSPRGYVTAHVRDWSITREMDDETKRRALLEDTTQPDSLWQRTMLRLEAEARNEAYAVWRLEP